MPPRLPLSLLALLACAVVCACSGAQAPRPAFDFPGQVVFQPVLRLPDGRSLEGGAAFVIVDALAATPTIVTLASLWEPPRGESAETWPSQVDLGSTRATLDLDAFDPPGQTALTGYPVIGGPGAVSDGLDQSENLLLFATNAPLPMTVEALHLDGRDAPDRGESLFLFGCQGQQTPCVETTHVVEVTEVHDGYYIATPFDFASAHAYVGAPVVALDGELVGIFAGRANSQTDELLFVPLTALRDRLNRARGF